jgi:hypothetical protein
MNRRYAYLFTWPPLSARVSRIGNGLLCRKAPLLMALFCVGLACGLVACRSDRRESFYPAFADADKDGAITRGWVPYFLPRSSRTIHELHRNSSPTEWCTFEFLPNDSQGLRKTLKSVDALPPSVSHLPSPGVPWWPNVLEGNLDGGKIHSEGFDLYVVVTPETSVTNAVSLFAIDWARGRGFFYGTRE